MAKTYYNYVQRKVEDQVDWTKIGVDISNMLNDEAKLREETKAEIDKRSQEYGKLIQDSPMGEHKGANEWILDYASQAQEARLLQDRLLKSGALDLRDYNIMRQNIVDDTNSIFSFAEEYNGKYKEVMDRYDNEESAFQEMFEWSLLEGYGNINNTKLYVNPSDYRLYVANLKDGKIDKTSFQPISALKARSMTRINRFDVNGAATKLADSFAGRLRQTLGDGMTISVDDITNKPEYKQVVTNFVNGVLKDTRNAASVLTDYIGVNPETGMSWDMTIDPKVAKDNPNMILVEPDPADPSSGRLAAKLTDKQKEEVRLALEARVKSAVETKYLETESTGAEYRAKRQAGERQQEEAANMLANLYQGDATDVEAASRYFSGRKDLGVRELERTPDGVLVTYNDGSRKEFPFATQDGTRLSIDQWVKSASGLADIADVNTAIEKAGIDRNAQFNEGAAISTEVPEQMPSYSEATIMDTSGEKMKIIKIPDIVQNIVNEVDNSAKALVRIGNEVLTKDNIGIDAEISFEKRGILSANRAIINIPGITPTPIKVPTSFNDENLSLLVKHLFDSAVSGTPVDYNLIKGLFDSEENFKKHNPSVKETTSTEIDFSKF